MRLLGLTILAIPVVLLLPFGVGALLLGLGGFVVVPLVAGSFAADEIGSGDPVPEPAWRETRPPL
jgi:hypothetical protein